MAKKTMTFEAALGRLEEILRMLEDGECPLADALKLYEEGVSLVRSCTQLLDQAEQTVKMLQLQPDGSAALVDFGTPAEEEA
ncbi:MAG: exodeoxyribonuclease VII small subunit [Clostridia bacterium]|nr:exodeoxyribonuclease VII small subunit [Clostridia bacterium]